MNLEHLLSKYNINTTPSLILSMWREPQRHYHNIGHLQDLLDMINRDRLELNYTAEQYETLLLVAYFHDVVYDPSRFDNEEKSAELFINVCKDKNNPIITDVHRTILDTKEHNGNSWLSTVFNKYDMDIVNRSYGELLEWEDGIRKEYPHVDNNTYKTHRLVFIDKVLSTNFTNTNNLIKLRKYIANEY